MASKTYDLVVGVATLFFAILLIWCVLFLISKTQEKAQYQYLDLDLGYGQFEIKNGGCIGVTLTNNEQFSWKELQTKFPAKKKELEQSYNIWCDK